MSSKKEFVSATVTNLLSAGLWIALSALVILYNKYILSTLQFPFPITLTMWHMLFSSVLSQILVRFKFVKSDNITASVYVSDIVPIGLLFAGTLWMGNAAYVFLSVSFIQMLKALMPAAVYGVGCFARTESPSLQTAANMAVITAGVALASAGEVAFVPAGVAFQLGSILSESVRLTMVQILLQRRGLKFNPVTTLYYVAPASLACLAMPWFFLEAPSVVTGSVVFPSAATLISNAVTAFALNIAVFLLIGRTSALTMNVAGVIKDWLLIWLSSLLFKSPVTALNLVGYSVAFGGVCWYNASKFKAAARTQKEEVMSPRHPVLMKQEAGQAVNAVARENDRDWLIKAKA